MCSSGPTTPSEYGTVELMDDLALHRRRGLLDAGFTDAELRQLRKTGELNMIRRGNYLVGPQPEYEADRHRLLVGASLAELAHGAVLSHASAAVLHGLPVWGMPLDRVSVKPGGHRPGWAATAGSAVGGAFVVGAVDRSDRSRLA